MLNALAAVGVGMELDIDFDSIREGLKNLGGLKRRFEIKDEKGGIVSVNRCRPLKPLEEHVGAYPKARVMLFRISCVTWVK